MPREGDGRQALALPSNAVTLDEALALSREHSPILAQARAALDAARANVEITDAAFLPTIQGNYSVQAFSSQTGFTGTPVGGKFPVLPVRGFGPGTQDFNIAEAQLKWTVFQFGKQLARHGQSMLKTEIADLQLVRSSQSVAFDVGQAYFRVLEAKAAVEIAEKAVQRAEAFQKESGDLLRRGVITREEYLRADARLAAVRQERTDARSEEEVAVAALNRAMGIDVNAPTRVVDRRQAPQLDLELDGALKLAVANRPEIPVVVRGIAVAEQDVKIAQADFLPSVSIQAGYSNVTGTGVQNANVGAGGIFVTQELYGGGRRRGQLRAASAGVRSATAQAQQVCDGIAYEVNVAFRGVEDARERIGTARASLVQASENLRLVTNRFGTGDATPSELIDARSAETSAEQTYNAAFYLYQRAILRLEFAVGTELPTGPEKLPSPPGAGPVPPAPPSGTSPFRPSAGAPGFPGLPPPLEFGGPPPATLSPLPTPPAPTPPGTPPLFGPPALSRPPYESTSPFGARP
ncbi:MAG: TolC family protein [Isosphaeraceae bacterium]|nr:TolC family protein [Isosphaeraceae bacterium]